MTVNNSLRAGSTCRPLCIRNKSFGFISSPAERLSTAHHGKSHLFSSANEAKSDKDAREFKFMLQ